MQKFSKHDRAMKRSEDRLSSSEPDLSSTFKPFPGDLMTFSSSESLSILTLQADGESGLELVKKGVTESNLQGQGGKRATTPSQMHEDRPRSWDNDRVKRELLEQAECHSDTDADRRTRKDYTCGIKSADTAKQTQAKEPSNNLNAADAKLPTLPLDGPAQGSKHVVTSQEEHEKGLEWNRSRSTCEQANFTHTGSQDGPNKVQHREQITNATETNEVSSMPVNESLSLSDTEVTVKTSSTSNGPCSNQLSENLFRFVPLKCKFCFIYILVPPVHLLFSEPGRTQ